MIGLQLQIPIASWRKGPSREYLETDILPPPATCYGALLSLVGETDRERHKGVRITAGLLSQPQKSTVLRTVWHIKNAKIQPGVEENARPDYQELLTDIALMIWCDSQDEVNKDSTLEQRVLQALREPSSIDRFGGWSLGESTHLINDFSLVPDAIPLTSCQAFLVDPKGDVSMPVWVDHVGAKQTRFVLGRLEMLCEKPQVAQLAQILV
ncbi:MAG: type I-MYXAN CRISPR-associated protein Cas5/Cmx5/DevS [Cyanobacteria bacterium NC_groundwater_1444_Ag_S-0.65um_54_12]|nr:type I-MYXAN CRISPR-associated protein Cas5/Cmx5/DevS [Cyanobacteria bacterium NC_groundwater_1444_Ag_S-0.65um_54_12]